MIALKVSFSVRVEAFQVQVKICGVASLQNFVGFGLSYGWVSDWRKMEFSRSG